MDSSFGIQIVHNPSRYQEIDSAVLSSLMRRHEVETSVGNHQISESVVVMDEQTSRQLTGAASLGYNYHRLLNALYFNSLKSDAKEEGIVVSLLEAGFSNRMVELQRARNEALPIMARDDVILDIYGKFLLAESEGIKISGFGYPMIMQLMLSASGVNSSQHLSFYSDLADRIKEKQSTGDNPEPIAIIMGIYDDFHKVDLTTVARALQFLGVETIGLREQALILNPTMLDSSKGIELPDGRYSRTLFAFPNAEEIAGGRLPQNSATEKLMDMYSTGLIDVLIPPKPFLGSKAGRVIVQDSRFSRIVEPLAESLDIDLQTLRNSIPQARFLTGEETTDEVREFFVKRSTQSGDGGVAGPGVEFDNRKASFLDEFRRGGKASFGSLTAEEPIQTQTFEISKNGNLTPNCFARFSTFRVGKETRSVVVTMRPGNPHVHLTEDSSAIPVILAGKEKTDTSLDILEALPRSEHDVNKVFATLPKNLNISQRGAVEKVSMNLDEIKDKLGVRNGSLFAKPNHIFTHDLLEDKDQIFRDTGLPEEKVIADGIYNVIGIFNRTITHLARQGLIGREVDMAKDRGRVEISDSEMAVLTDVFRFMVNIQRFSTPRYPAMVKDDASKLIETLVLKTMAGKTIRVGSIVCVGYDGNQLQEELSDETSEVIENFSAMFPNSIGRVKFKRELIFANDSRIMRGDFLQNYRPSFANTLEEELARELECYRKIGSSLGCLVEGMGNFVDMDKLLELSKTDEVSSLVDSKGTELLNNLIYVTSTGRLARKLHITQARAEEMAREDARQYTSFALLASKEDKLDILAATEGYARSRFYFVGGLPSVWAAGDKEIKWKK